MLAYQTFIALGSNLDDPIEHIRRALIELQQLPQTQFRASSRYYRSHPMGDIKQPDVINAVVELETHLSAYDLLHELQAIEQRHGRVRQQRWGPRTLDLDILLYGQEVIEQVDLRIPHPGIAKRNFVLFPLAEIAPDLLFPSGQSLEELLKRHTWQGLKVLDWIG